MSSFNVRVADMLRSLLLLLKQEEAVEDCEEILIQYLGNHPW